MVNGVHGSSGGGEFDTIMSDLKNEINLLPRRLLPRLSARSAASPTSWDWKKRRWRSTCTWWATRKATTRGSWRRAAALTQWRSTTTAPSFCRRHATSAVCTNERRSKLSMTRSRTESTPLVWGRWECCWWTNHRRRSTRRCSTLRSCHRWDSVRDGLQAAKL